MALRLALGPLLGLTVGLAPLCAHANGRAPAAVAKTALPQRFEVRPPKGFRPSEAAVMLCDSVSSYKNGRWTPHPMISPRASEGRMVIAVRSEIMSSKNASDRASLAHVLGFAKSNGFTIAADDATPAQRHRLAGALKSHGVDHLVVR